MNKVISIYYVFEDATGEYAKILKQSVFSEEALKKYKNQAHEKTMGFLEKGLYLHRWEVFLHPKGATKPYQTKYKVSLN